MTPAEIVEQARKNPSDQDVVIYHAGCSDGFGAAFAAWFALEGKGRFFPASHGKFKPMGLEGRFCFIVDFSFDLETLLQLERQFKAVLVLDHHIDAEPALLEFKTAVFDLNRSGAGITWDTFLPEIERPTIINYIEDRDLWNRLMPDSDAIFTQIETLPYEFEAWEDFVFGFAGNQDKIANDGRAALAYKNHLIGVAAKQARRVKIHGFDVPFANADAALKSDLGNVLAKDEAFAVVWRQAADGTFLYSLRSNEQGEDVNKIAARFGGGGHRHSAAFVSDRLLG